MTRTVKFRLWVPADEDEDDPRPGYMVDGDDLAFEEFAPLTDLLSQERIMQWTGFLDFAGAEIYEGDFLSWWDGLNNPDTREGIGEVVWSGEWGAWVVTGVEEFLASLLDGWETHLVGNRFENPELTEVVRRDG